jgi:hypothetical protein
VVLFSYGLATNYYSSGRPYRIRTCDTLIKSKKHDVPPSSLR